MMGFGSVRDFDKPGYYIRNAMFPKQREEMHVNQTPKIETQIYKMDADNLFKRKEHAEHIKAYPYFLHPDDVQVIGERTCEKPFYVKGLALPVCHELRFSWRTGNYGALKRAPSGRRHLDEYR